MKWNICFEIKFSEKIKISLTYSTCHFRNVIVALNILVDIKVTIPC